MTRNVFLGADLGPAIEASSIPEAIDGAGVIWNEFRSTSFRDRAAALAREIKRSKAHLVGLQEVALWRRQATSDGGAPPIGLRSGAPATEVVQDLLRILRRKLRRIDARYRVVVVQRSSTPSCRSTRTARTRPGPGRSPRSAPTSTRGSRCAT
jgi:hypothetical protein